jgi:hypothetical protein
MKQIASASVTGRRASAWYRDPWRLLVVAPPLAAILAGIWTLWLATTSWDGLVVDDYYKQGLEINQVLARDQKARALGLALDVAWTNNAADEPLGSLVLNCTGAGATSLPEELEVNLVHGTRAGFDRHLTVARVAAGRYQTGQIKLAPGRWQVHVNASDWRLTGEFLIQR